MLLDERTCRLKSVVEVVAPLQLGRPVRGSVGVTGRLAVSGLIASANPIKKWLQGLAPGTYSASVTVTAIGATNGLLRPQAAGGGSVTVGFSLTAQGSDSLQMTYSPNVSQSLQLTSAGTASGSIAVTGSNSGLPGMYFGATSAVQTPPGGNWLSIVQNGSQTNATVSVLLQRGSLSPGTYRGSVALLDTFNNLTSVPVVLIVPPPPTLSAACTPSCSGSGATGQSVSLGNLSVATSDPTQPISFCLYQWSILIPADERAQPDCRSCEWSCLRRFHCISHNRPDASENLGKRPHQQLKPCSSLSAGWVEDSESPSVQALG